MDADEKSICIYLRSFPNQFVSAREISRRAGGKWRFREDQDWAIKPLERLIEAGLVETDSTGHFRLVRKQEDDKKQAKKWVSPQIKKLLEQSGKTIDIEQPDEEF